MGFFKRLFKKQVHEHGPALSEADAHGITRVYLEVLHNQAPPTGYVLDICNLAHSKPHIKQALALVLQGETKSERKAELAAGYLRLAYWQANVGEAPRTLDSSSIDLDAEPMHFAEELLTHGERPEHWRDIVDAEKDVLRKELQTLGITV